MGSQQVWPVTNNLPEFTAQPASSTTKNPKSNDGEVLNKQKEDSNIKFNLSYFITSIFKYKSQVILLLFIFYLFSDIKTYLGINYVSGFIIAIILLLMGSNILQSYSITDNDKFITEGLGIFKQAKIPKINKNDDDE